MNKISKKQKPMLLFLGVAVLVLLVLFTVSHVTKMKNYDCLLSADRMDIYDGDTLICSSSTPADILDTDNDIVGVGVVDLSYWERKKAGLSELYRLEFIEDNEKISTIKILASTSANQSDFWRKLCGNDVILYEDGHYFIFGQDFFDRLSELIRE